MTCIRECPFLQGSVTGVYGVSGRPKLRAVMHNRLEQSPALATLSARSSRAKLHDAQVLH